MADYIDPQRTSQGKIPLSNLPPQDMNRFSFGKIGDQPIPNADFGALAQPAATAPEKPSLLSRLSPEMANTRNVLQQGAADIRDAYAKGGMGPAIGMLARAAVAGPLAVKDDLLPGADGSISQGARTFMTGKTATAATPGASAAQAPVEPVPATSKLAVPVQGAEKAPARTLDTLDYSARPTSAPSVQRIDQKGQAPLFTNLDPAAAVAEMKGNPIGVVPAGANPFGSSTGSADVSAALQAAAARGDWDAIRNHYQQNGGTWQGKTSDDGARGQLLKALTTVQPGRDNLSSRQAQLLTSLLTGERAADTQALTAQGQLLLALTQASLGQQQVNQHKALQDLMTQYSAESDPARQADIARKILVMQGKDPRGDTELQKSRNALVAEAVKAYTSSPLPPAGPDGKPLTLDAFVQQTLQAAGGAQPATPAVPKGAAEVKARFAGGQITREQALAELKKLGMN